MNKYTLTNKKFSHEDICRICLEGSDVPDCPLEKPCKAITEDLYCHVCGNPGIIHEGLAEGHWCPKCGSSDQDE